jgi:hypothetical protein
MPGLPWEAANAETTISGAEVPKPTITIPISSGGMPKWRALAAEPPQKDRRSRPEAPDQKGYLGTHFWEQKRSIHKGGVPLQRHCLN